MHKTKGQQLVICCWRTRW